MNRLLFVLLLLFFFNNAFSQNLENEIYEATEVFNSTKTESALEVLNIKIAAFKTTIKTEDEHFAFINLLLNKGYYLSKNNKQQQAITTYEDAWTRYKKENIANLFQFDIIEYCLIPLGVLYHKTNNYTNAENVIKHYIFLAEQQKNESHLASGAINLSNLYQKLGKHQLAIDVSTKGLQIKNLKPYQKRRLKSIKSRSEIRLNKTIIIIDNPHAQMKLPNISDAYTKTQLEYELAYKKGDYKEALKKFNSLKSLGNNKMSSARMLAKRSIEEAHLYTLLEDNNTAAKQLKIALRLLIPNFNSNGLPDKNDIYPENTFIDLFDALAQLQTDSKQALQCYDLSFYASSLLDNEITSQEGQLIQLSNNRKRSAKCIQLLYELSNTDESTYYTEQAFIYAEHFKSNILKESIAKKTLLETYPNDSLLIKEQHLLKQQEQLTNQLIKTPYNKKEHTSTLRVSLSSLSIQLKTLKKEIDKKYNSTQNRPISLSEITKKLQKDNATLIEYFYGNDAIFQFIISENAIEFNRIPLNEIIKNDIITFISYFDNASVINNNITQYTTDAFSLYETLLINRVTDKTNLIIIPDGFINFIPFDALLTSKSNSLTFESMPFVVKQHKLAYNSSAALYLKTEDHVANQSVLGIFPIFENSNKSLEYSKEEAKSINNTMDANLLMNTSATKDDFISKAKEYTILHLSTHAKSGNFINPASIEFADSSLSLNELYALDLNTDLVVLSACETGIGQLKYGEGAMSLARGFQYAGAKNMLFSLWKISDLSTSQIIESFYKNYNKNKSAYVSNNQSKLDYLQNESITNIKKSPYYWSAFTFYGNLSKPKKNNYKYLSIIAVAMLIALLLFLGFKKRNGKHTSRLFTKQRL